LRQVEPAGRGVDGGHRYHRETGLADPVESTGAEVVDQPRNAFGVGGDALHRVSLEHLI
jgi:hypothetical protein